MSFHLFKLAYSTIASQVTFRSEYDSPLARVDGFYESELGTSASAPAGRSKRAQSCLAPQA